MIQKMEQIIIKAEKLVFSSIMLVMALILIAHVTMRYLFNSPLIWTDEVTTMLQGTITFLGIGYCFRCKQHTELSLLYDKVPTAVQILFDLTTNGIMLFCLVYMTRTGFGFVNKQMIQLGTVPWLYKGYFYIFIPIGFLIAMAYIILRLAAVFKRVKDLRGGK